MCCRVTMGIDVIRNVNEITRSIMVRRRLALDVDAWALLLLLLALLLFDRLFVELARFLSCRDGTVSLAVSNWLYSVVEAFLVLLVVVVEVLVVVGLNNNKKS